MAAASVAEIVARKIWCCGCGEDVDARLTSGQEIYPRRMDLWELPFWRCDRCTMYVGCHHKTRDRTRPLGCIPDQAMKDARVKIHKRLDPLWLNGWLPRPAIYERLGVAIGRKYHTAELRTLDEARAVYRAILAIEKEVRADGT